jgi:5'-nucleotidase
MPEKKVLFLDMDDVMADTALAFLQTYNEHFSTSYTKEQIKEGTIWQDEIAENYKEIRGVIFKPGFFRDIAVMPRAVEVVEALHDKYDVFVASAAMEFPTSLKDKHDWLNEHFPFIHWKNMIMCGAKSILKGDILIDDHLKNLSVFDGQAILFDGIHNQHIDGYKRVLDWNEVGELLL